MAKKARLRAKHRGEIEIGDIRIPCMVLNDGTRVVAERGLMDTFGNAGGKGYELRKNIQDNAAVPLPRFLALKALEPFVEQLFDVLYLDAILYINNGKLYKGYHAEILPSVCEAWIMAREAGTLQKSQIHKAQKAQKLMCALARVGIIALVDEATGYQYEREQFELQKILAAYIGNDVAEWQLTFTMEFYKEMFRLWGQPFNPKSIKKPSFVGTLTNKYIYKALPEGVLEAIKAKTPKTANGNNKHKFHQVLTPEVGRQHLKRQIIEVTTLMKVCDTKEQFDAMFERRYSKHHQNALQFAEAA